MRIFSIGNPIFDDQASHLFCKSSYCHVHFYTRKDPFLSKNRKIYGFFKNANQKYVYMPTNLKMMHI